MKILSKLICLILVLGLLCPVSAQQKNYVSFENPGELQQYLCWTSERVPLVSAQRGGPMRGFPENCIETFENALLYAPCLIECDVAETKDSVPVMMHDRTTTGTGRVKNCTLEEIKALKLKDNQGNITRFQIPTLAEVLNWARGKAILELDIKEPVMPEEITAIIREKKTVNYTVVITYDLPTARLYHRLNPDLMISASARGVEGARRLLESEIDPQCLIVFVGVYEPSGEVYALLHSKGIRSILGTMGNLDKKAEKRGLKVYRQLIKNGADILATNNVRLTARAIVKE